jgi:hypothetical protein
MVEFLAMTLDFFDPAAVQQRRYSTQSLVQSGQS